MNRIKVYYTTIESDYSDFDILPYINSLPNSLHEKILKIKHNNTRYSKLFGLLLLQHGLKIEGNNEQILTKLEYTIKGKPYISGANKKFNISHSSNLVVCAFSNSKIGIDIEKIRDVNIGNFRSYFSDDEYTDIENSSVINKLFFQYWTKKESFAKAIGEGLTISFANVIFNENRINYNHQNWFNHELSIKDDFIANICVEQQYSKIEIEEIIFHN
jgi:4'-phosphopantetheinyl transferase